MPSVKQVACTMALAASVLSARTFAQNTPALTISPGKATMLVGETRTFRAVGRDGRIRHGVRWGISPQQAVTLTLDGDEAVVQAKQASSNVTLTAYADGDSADATVEIRSESTLPVGSQIWSVPPIPGCKSEKLIQAVPSANGPDLYDQEQCPRGTVIRALTADGRELWRRQITGAGGVLANEPVTKPPADTGQHLDLHRSSICDGISPGMTKDEVSKVANGRSLSVGKKQWQGDSWEFEEEGSRCAISFDEKSGAVVKKKKTIIID
ncbi:MAG TPA: hypothetical protein VKA07_09640 [Candidatus Sulfotelmatobacter sp.]|nr:hypothetical protein [Candidatus Sulfotelmatobacter sp.]